MRFHYLQHVPFEGPAHIAAIAETLGVSMSGTKLFDNAQLPSTSDFDALFVMGGPMSVHDEPRYAWLKREKEFVARAISEGKKVIGICLGAQIIAEVLGAKVYKNQFREIGWFPLRKTVPSGLSAGDIFPESFHAFHWHGETFSLPPGALHCARSEACENQAFSYGDNVLALQFHLESTVESVNLLIDHASDELDGSRYVQPVEALRDTKHLRDSNVLMRTLIKKWIIAPGDN